MAATNLNTVRSKIECRVKDEMEGGAPPIPVVFSNVSYKPKANKSFVQCLVSFGKNEYLTMKVERMNEIRYKLCNDEIEYMDMLDEFVDLAMAVLNDDK